MNWLNRLAYRAGWLTASLVCFIEELLHNVAQTVDKENS